MNKIRNFSIIAHIDHGKSTLSDRIIEFCGGLSKREMKAQVLDTLELERERGITIKAQSVALTYTDDQEYQFNLIDTPGHVDFSYEVSRSLAACEGALLVVDGSQGVEAQTLSTCYKAIDLGLEVIPVINKIDLPQAEPERVKKEIEEIIGIDASEALSVSAKDGTNLNELMQQIAHKIPAPKKSDEENLQALIIDSWYDNFLGVISLIRIFSGQLKKGDKFIVKSTGQTFTADTIGKFTPKKVPCDVLNQGEVGYLVASVKDLKSVPVGDTLVAAKFPETKELDGFEEVKPQVFASFFPIESNDYQAFREALQKLNLNDASLVFEPENSEILGSGFRCGFLGTLHMEVVKERLEREYDLDLITTAPSVAYEVLKTNGEELSISSPAELPTPNEIEEIREPIIKSTVLCPNKYVGDVIELAMSKRGVQKDLQYLGGQVSIIFEMPLSEIVMDFFDILKSKSQGYASVDFVFDRFQKADLVIWVGEDLESFLPTALKSIPKNSVVFPLLEQSGLKKSSREECLKKGDLIITNQPLGDDELKLIKPNSTILGMINPFGNQALIESCSNLKINLVSMEFIPRITRAQKMDVLSSQANLAGYVAVIESAKHLSTALPMMMTAAGTLKPAKVFVIGVGVAGLQAIATAKRLGARVEAFDTRDVVEEQVNSLGAKFVKIDLGDTGQTEQGYAKELTPEQISKQKELQSLVCERSDIVITTAQIFGRPAPKIIDKATIKKMKPGSVILDMAVETGGNVEGSVTDEVVDINGVKVVGISYLASKVSSHASFALSNNIINWITDFYDEESHILNFDFEDEVIQSSVLAYEGKIMNERFA